MKTKKPSISIILPESYVVSSKSSKENETNSGENDKTAAGSSSEYNEKISEYRKKLGVRHIQCFLLFCCLTVAYALRVNLSVAIVAMYDKLAANPDFEEYHWGEGAKSLLLSSFFWGYVFTQVPGGLLASKYGAKMLLLGSILICSLLNILTPQCAKVGGWQLLCALRVMQGLCQGVIFPCTHTLLSKWAPVEERGRLGTYCYSGSQLGTVLMVGTSGAIASSSLGWPGIFYLSGTAGIIWSILWFILGANSPAEYKRISPEERQMIEKSLGENDNQNMPKLKTPWLAILTSRPFYALLIVHCAHNWGFWTLLTELPSYLKNVLDMDIKNNALLSALPYSVMFILSFFFSYLATLLTKHQCISLPISRKLFNSIGHWVPMVALIGLAYLTKNETNAVIGLLTIAVGINSATYLGFQVNHIDLSPNFAGTLMGITNCAANIMSIIAPLLVGFVVTDSTDPTQWRIVFFIAAGIYFFGNLMFVLFGKTEVQPWNSREGVTVSRSEMLRRRSSAFVEAVGSHN